MTGRTPGQRGTRDDRWSEQIAALAEEAPRGRTRKDPITVNRIVETAFSIVKTEGFESLTMRRVAGALKTGPASLYAHVHNKAELDDLLIGELCAQVTLPVPDKARWREQIVDVCQQLRDQFLLFPGISRAALAAAPRNLDTTRISEGMLGILLAGGVTPRDAAWAIDAAYLYVSAYCLEASLRSRAGGKGDGSIGGGLGRNVGGRPGGNVGEGAGDVRAAEREETIERLRMLPPDMFPHTVAYAEELTSGESHERFDFTLGLLFGGLRAPEGSTGGRFP